MKVAGVLVLANVTIKGAKFWGLERRKNVVPIRSTFKVGQCPSDYFLLANQSPRSCTLPTDLSKEEVNLCLHSPMVSF